MFGKHDKEEQQPTKAYGMQLSTCPRCRFTTPGCLCEASGRATTIQLQEAAAERKAERRKG